MTVSHFEELYSADPDPFGVGDRWYERRKRALLTASLTSERYRSTWDSACGTGHLATSLADRSDLLLATDASPAACRLATERLSGVQHATVATHLLPDPPDGSGPFDLVVLSEVLYYLDAGGRAATARTVDLVADRSATAEVIAVNWRHRPSDAQTSGEESVLELDEALRSTGWSPAVRHDDEDFVLRSWRHAATTA